ncbi:unnamed protein product [Amoebophrya sp. A120]|nr:unnamed protein product [Amoebophrya sp. A120]|eukprot:GSA120T00018602001.1
MRLLCHVRFRCFVMYTVSSSDISVRILSNFPNPDNHADPINLPEVLKFPGLKINGEKKTVAVPNPINYVYIPPLFLKSLLLHLKKFFFLFSYAAAAAPRIHYLKWHDVISFSLRSENKSCTR